MRLIIPKKNLLKVITLLGMSGLLFGSAVAETYAQTTKSNGQIHVYVSPKGNDRNAGTKQAPLQSLEGARDRLRTIRKPGQPATVHVGGGTYGLLKSLELTSEDGGTVDAPVVYTADPGQSPLFSGSRKIKDWKVLRDQKALTRLPASVHGKVYVADLNQAGITDFGDATDLGLRPELVCNKKLQTLARWPNTGLTTAGQVHGETALPQTYMAKRGTKEGVFDYINPRQNQWALESDPRLGGYWYWDWSEQFQKVDKIDTASHTVYIRPPFHNYGYKDSLHYFGLNLFCEIDTAGEWYLDRTKGLLYWYPPKGVNPVTADVSLSLFASPFMVDMQNCSYLTLMGLAFEEGRGSAVRIEGGSNSLISDCRIERFGTDGIHIVGGWNHGISGCLLRTLGCGGIKMSGGDRKSLQPGGHFVEHTVVEYFSLFKRTYQPAIHMEGCGLRISHNRFRYSSSSAMRLEGNDVMIEYNQISHVVNESDDQGGLDVFYNPSYRGNVVRYNHWSDISGGTLHGAAGVRLDDMISGFHIYGNMFERCGARHFGAVQIHGGKDNLVENNLFFKCPSGVSFSTWGEKRWLKELDSPAIRKRIYEDVDILSEPYVSRYPALKELRINADVNRVENNLMVDCENILRNGKLQVSVNNIPVASEGKPLGAFADAAYLTKQGLKPIPFKEMGPQKGVGMK
jgi:hypothetical protein